MFFLQRRRVETRKPFEVFKTSKARYQEYKANLVRETAFQFVSGEPLMKASRHYLWLLWWHGLHRGFECVHRLV
jgi:hypothetical protein